MAKATIYKEVVEFIGDQGDYEVETEIIAEDMPINDALDEWIGLTNGMLCEWSSCPVLTTHDWITAYPQFGDTDQDTTYSIHFRGVTMSSMQRIGRILGAR